jgi:hypothetical protein
MDANKTTRSTGNDFFPDIIDDNLADIIKNNGISIALLLMKQAYSQGFVKRDERLERA